MPTKTQKLPVTPVKKMRPTSTVPLTLHPGLNAAAVIGDYSKSFGEQDVLALSTALGHSIATIATGNLGDCEAMLLGQAYALQAIFTTLSRRAVQQEYMKNLETYLRLAFKAQNQCRMTLETLAMIKHPPVVFAHQANIARGPQQVNNGMATPATVKPTRAEKIKPAQNELLEKDDEQWLDTGTAQTPSSNDSTLETMATISRSHD